MGFNTNLWFLSPGKVCSTPLFNIAFNVISNISAGTTAMLLCSHISLNQKCLSYFYLIVLEEKFKKIFLFVWLRNHRNVFWFFFFFSWMFLQLVTEYFNPHSCCHSGDFWYQLGWLPIPRSRLTSPSFCCQYDLYLYTTSAFLLHCCMLGLLEPQTSFKYWIQLFYSVMSVFYSSHFPIYFSSTTTFLRVFSISSLFLSHLPLWARTLLSFLIIKFNMVIFLIVLPSDILVYFSKGPPTPWYKKLIGPWCRRSFCLCVAFIC